MNDFFEGVKDVTDNVLMTPFDSVREMELENWWLANLVTWVAILILIAALGYWMQQLRIFEQNNEEDKTQTAHSFLGKNQL
ncbi:MAG: uracil phosphoribosyltransferase [Nonlabens sp.]